MTTPEQQVAANHRAVTNLAARLERLGYGGDSHAEAEHIAAELHADGWRALPKPVPVRGPGASRASIDAALTACRSAVDAARTRTATPATKETSE
jgi:hypothetical protein